MDSYFRINGVQVDNPESVELSFMDDEVAVVETTVTTIYDALGVPQSTSTSSTTRKGSIRYDLNGRKVVTSSCDPCDSGGGGGDDEIPEGGWKEDVATQEVRPIMSLRISGSDSGGMGWLSTAQAQAIVDYLRSPYRVIRTTKTYSNNSTRQTTTRENLTVRIQTNLTPYPIDAYFRVEPSSTIRALRPRIDYWVYDLQLVENI